MIKPAEPMFNKKVEVLNRYLSVVVDRPRVFVWRHKILDSPSHDFLLEYGVHLIILVASINFALQKLPRSNFKGCEHFE